jgi:acyl-CoA hydrolase
LGINYNGKLRSAREAAKVIRSGDHVVLAPLCGTAHLLPELFMESASDLRDVRLFQLRPLGTARERAKELVRIAHTDFVEALYRDDRKLNLLS